MGTPLEIDVWALLNEQGQRLCPRNKQPAKHSEIGSLGGFLFCFVFKG